MTGYRIEMPIYLMGGCGESSAPDYGRVGDELQRPAKVQKQIHLRCVRSEATNVRLHNRNADLSEGLLRRVVSARLWVGGRRVTAPGYGTETDTC